MLTDGPRVAAFARRYLRHTKGRWAGQPLIFEAWQQEFLDEAFRIDEASGLRVYREVVLGIPRKNGKSTVAAGIALYLLVADGEAEPEVYVAAAAKAQAGIVFRQVRRFIEASSGLIDFARPRQYHIDCAQNGGILRVISSDAPLQHGLSPHGSIIDELHAHRSPDLYTALTTGGGAREQPLTMTISTAGADDENVLARIYQAALAKTDLVERRAGLTIVRDPATKFLLWWYGAAADDDPDDPAVWAAANPASWITAEYLETERGKPTLTAADFRRYHLNQWVRSIEEWLPAGAWAACSSADYSSADPWHGLDPTRPVSVGIDYGAVDDTTAIAVAQRVPMPEGRRDPETPSAEDRVILRVRIIAPDPDLGMRTDITEVMDQLRALRVRFPAPAARIDGRQIAGPAYHYDPWGFRSPADILASEGLAMVEVPQTDARMVPASTELYGLVMSRRLSHDGNPTLAEHIANVVGRHRGTGWRITKQPGSAHKIDGAIASALAVHGALSPWPARRIVAFVA